VPLERQRLDHGRRRAVAGVGEAKSRTGDRERGGEHRLVDDAHRGGGLGHAVEHDAIAAATGAGVAVGAGDGDLLLQAFALVLLDEFLKRQRAEAAEENRFVLAQYFHVEELAFGIDRHQQVHRRAFETRDRRQVDRLEDIADRAGIGLEFAGQRPGRNFPQLFADMQRTLEAAFDVGLG
jgi:hypothetical protein